MNANAPLVSILKVDIYQQLARIGLTLGADLGDRSSNITIYLNGEQAMACAHAFKQAERILSTGKSGSISGWPSICMDMDIDMSRGGIVLTVHVESDEHCFFLPEGPVFNQCTDALLAAALDFQTPNQEKRTWH